MGLQYEHLPEINFNKTRLPQNVYCNYCIRLGKFKNEDGVRQFQFCFLLRPVVLE